MDVTLSSRAHPKCALSLPCLIEMSDLELVGLTDKSPFLDTFDSRLNVKVGQKDVL